jgi:hypothetical protein
MEDLHLPSGLSGGRKTLWLKAHNKEVLSYYASFGRDATMRRYGMQPTTFNNFLLRNNMPAEPVSDTEVLSIKIQIIDAKLNDVRADVTNMKNAFTNFSEAVSKRLEAQIMRPFIRALLADPPDIKLSKDNDLCLEDLNLPGDKTKPNNFFQS